MLQLDLFQLESISKSSLSEVYSEKSQKDLKNFGFGPDMVMANISRGKEMKSGGIRLESLNPVFIISGTQKEYLGE